MIVLRGHASHNGPVPLVPISPASKHGRTPFKRHVLGASNLVPADVGIDDPLPHIVAGITLRDVGKNLVEEIELTASRFVLHDSAILPETAKRKITDDAGMHNEWRPRSSRWKLPTDQRGSGVSKTLNKTMPNTFKSIFPQNIETLIIDQCQPDT